MIADDPMCRSRFERAEFPGPDLMPLLANSAAADTQLARRSLPRHVEKMRTLLRPMRAPDLPAMQALWVAAWQATMPAIDFSKRRVWLAAHLRDLHQAGAVTLCAVPQAAVAGFLTWFPSDGLVEQLAVHPARFGHGIGSALLDAAKRQRPAGLHLLVNQENRRAVAFYRRAGFDIRESTTNPGGTRPVWRMGWPT